MVDLNPTGFVSSDAAAISGTSQVGEGYGPITGGTDFDPVYHALLWHGTAQSAVDLTPPGFDGSAAEGVSNAGQVGFGWNKAAGGSYNMAHALVWNGTAASAVDLHPFLSGLGLVFINSHAQAIADDGSMVGYATDTNNTNHAILWTPVPEPATYTLLALAISIQFLRRSR